MGKNEEVMPRERDEKSGKYVENYPPEEFIGAIRDADNMASTQDVVDRVGCSYETAYKKLRALEDTGDVQSRKVANARLWLIQDDGE